MSLPLLESMVEVYTRQIKVDGSEGYLGLRLGLTITRPDTTGEQTVFSWLRSQDDCYLLDMMEMSNGRYYTVFRRQFVQQSYMAAQHENEMYQRLLLRFPMQDDCQDESGDTPT